MYSYTCMNKYGYIYLYDIDMVYMYIYNEYVCIHIYGVRRRIEQ
jgi:hypothetical protein